MNWIKTFFYKSNKKTIKRYMKTELMYYRPNRSWANEFYLKQQEKK